jgi:DNA-binding NarL/FixJ family response regulator
MAILLCCADDSILNRWKDLLSDGYDFEEALTLSELQDRCAETSFKLILLHRSMVDAESFTAIRRITPQSRFFLLSDQPHEEEGLAFLKLGIVGYANTYISAERITEAVRVITSGAVWLGQKVMQRLILESYARAKQQAVADSEVKLATLTQREREIANLIAQGQSNLEIAANLDITERTVKAHLSSIYEKTGTGSRLNLALMVNRG